MATLNKGIALPQLKQNLPLFLALIAAGLLEEQQDRTGPRAHVPVERVVFLLADVFAVPFEEIARTVDRSPDACRQIASRARRRVHERRGRPRSAGFRTARPHA